MDKKKLRWIIISVAAVFSIVATTLSLLVLDPTPSPYINEHLSNDQTFNKIFVESFRNIKESKEIEYSLNHDSLNQLLINLEEKYGHIHVEINNKNYRFFIKSSLLLIPTRIVIDTSLETADNGYIFRINNIKTGKLNTYGLLNSTGKLNNSHLQEIFNEIGLSLKIDYNNKAITYSYDDFEQDLDVLIHKNASDIFLGITDESITSYAINDEFTVKKEISSLEENIMKSDSRLDGPHYANYSLLTETINNKANEIVDLVSKGVNSESIQTYASSTFSELKSFEEKGEDITSIVKTKILEKPISEYSGSGFDKEVSFVNELEINDILKSSDIIGKSAIFYHETELVYALIDKFYCDIFCDEFSNVFINYTIGLNINGLETRAIIETKRSLDMNEYVCDFDIINIYYGERLATSSFKSFIKQLFKTALESISDNCISFNSSNNVVTINFMDFIKEDVSLASYKTIFYDTIGTRKIVAISDGLNEIGRLSLRYIRD